MAYTSIKHKSILAALFFFCHFLLGLRLSYWQFTRYQEKSAIENQSLVQNAQTLYSTFQAKVQLDEKQKPVISLLPNAKEYQVYCPIKYLSGEDRKEAYLKVDRLIDKNDIADLQNPRAFCSETLSHTFLKMAMVPVKRNIFIPHQLLESLEVIQVNQISDMKGFESYLIENPKADSFYVLTPEKHLGYSFQWLGLSLLSLCFCAIFIRDQKFTSLRCKAQKLT